MSYKSLRSEAVSIIRKNIREDMEMGIPNLSQTPMSGYVSQEPRETSDDPDQGGSMAKIELRAMADMASQLEMILQDDQKLEPWIQAKLAMAKQDLTGVYNYMKYKK